MSTFYAMIGLAVSLTLAPLLFGLINRVKAKVGGRQGKPLLQLYFDLHKLWHKRSVYPAVSTWLFRVGPPITLAAMFCGLILMPFGNLPSVLSFSGDFLLLSGLLALARLAQILAALDTGSAFEGMGAAREAIFSAMAEPIFLLCLAGGAYATGEFSLTGIFSALTPAVWAVNWLCYLFLSAAFFLLLLIENKRIPVDDPNTHLELTMIHEVMLLDHSGPELAMAEYASALKFWLFSLIIAALIVPLTTLAPLTQIALTTLVVFAVAILVGVVESIMARLRMERVHHILTLAASCAGLAALAFWRQL